MLICKKKFKKNTEEQVNKPSTLRDEHNIEALMASGIYNVSIFWCC